MSRQGFLSGGVGSKVVVVLRAKPSRVAPLLLATRLKSSSTSVHVPTRSSGSHSCRTTSPSSPLPADTTSAENDQWWQFCVPPQSRLSTSAAQPPVRARPQACRRCVRWLGLLGPPRPRRAPHTGPTPPPPGPRHAERRPSVGGLGTSEHHPVNTAGPTRCVAAPISCQFAPGDTLRSRGPSRRGAFRYVEAWAAHRGTWFARPTP